MHMNSIPPRMASVHDPRDVPMMYRGTAIADLLAYHNLGAPHRRYDHAELLVGMCMDHRMRLRIPENFVYVAQAAGTNFLALQFQVSFAIAVGGVRAIAVIGHDQCGMSGLGAQRDAVVAGLVDGAGWERHVAERHFDEFAPRFEIGDPVEFTRGQARHFRQQYPKVTVAPMFYQRDDGMLYLVEEGEDMREEARQRPGRTRGRSSIETHLSKPKPQAWSRSISTHPLRKNKEERHGSQELEHALRESRCAGGNR